MLPPRRVRLDLPAALWYLCGTYGVPMNAPQTENRTEAVMVRFSPQELAVIEQAMKWSGLNRAQYLRFCALKVATAVSTPVPGAADGEAR